MTDRSDDIQPQDAASKKVAGRTHQPDPLHRPPANPDANLHPNWTGSDLAMPEALLNIAAKNHLHWNPEAHAAWNGILKVLDRPGDARMNETDGKDLQTVVTMLQQALGWQPPPPSPDDPVKKASPKPPAKGRQ